MLTVVANNLLRDKDYRPYCGNIRCKDMPRVDLVGILKFKCPCCGWESKFNDEFTELYKKKHNIK